MPNPGLNNADYTFPSRSLRVSGTTRQSASVGTASAGPDPRLRPDAVEHHGQHGVAAHELHLAAARFRAAVQRRHAAGARRLAAASDRAAIAQRQQWYVVVGEACE